MSKIRLVSPSFRKFSGVLGDIQFQEGVSVNELSLFDKRRIGAITRTVDLDGRQVSMIKDMEVRDIPAPARAKSLTKEEIDAAKALAPKVVQEVVAQPIEDSEDETEKDGEENRVYSRIELEFIADDGGMPALREIADKLDVRSRSIKGLIVGILKAQSRIEG